VENNKAVSKLGEILCRRGLIAPEQLDEVLQLQRSNGKRIGEILLDKGWVEERKLAEVLADIFDLPFFDLSQQEPDFDVIKLLPFDFLEKNNIAPVSAKEDALILAVADPLNTSALQDVQYMSSFAIKPVISCRTDIEEFLRKCEEILPLTGKGKSKGDSGPDDESVIKLADSIIQSAVKQKASDIHLESLQAKMRVRFRIDGVLYEKNPIPKGLDRKVISRLKILSGMDVAISRHPQDGRMGFEHGGKAYDIRVSTLPNLQGENMVLRVLSKSFIKRSFADLGLTDNDQQTIRRLLSRPYGLILLTGPTGAGKTTTLYSMLQTLNQISTKIITVEDPIEYELEGINQTATNQFTGYDFPTAIRHILRDDPDIIMVGEIRDVETAETAIRAALTGHLVLSTMHTNSAAGAVTRFLEMKLEPFLVASTLIGVVAQRLVRKLCPYCQREFVPDQSVLQKISGYISLRPQDKFAAAPGCKECLKTGYAGRTGIYEILEMNQDIRRLILKGEDEQKIQQAALQGGMKTLRMDGLLKAAKKITTIDEVVRTAFID